MKSKEKEIIKRIAKDFFQKNSDNYHIEMAFLYGSYARGLPGVDSDIDIALLFSQDLTENEIFEHITEISLALSNELHLEVNIIPVYSDFRKPMLYYNAIVLGNPLFFRDFTRYVDIKNEAIRQMEDFAIFGRYWQITGSQKNIEAILGH